MSFTKFGLLTKKAAALLGVAGVLLFAGGAAAGTDYTAPTATFSVSGTLTEGTEGNVTVTFVKTDGSNGEASTWPTLATGVPSVSAAINTSNQSLTFVSAVNGTSGVYSVTYKVTPSAAGTLTVTVGDLTFTMTNPTSIPTSIDVGDKLETEECVSNGSAGTHIGAESSGSCAVSTATFAVTPTATTTGANEITVNAASAAKTVAVGAQSPAEANAVIFSTPYVTFPVETNVPDGNYEVIVKTGADAALPAGITLGNEGAKMRVTGGRGTLVLNIANNTALTLGSDQALKLTLKGGPAGEALATTGVTTTSNFNLKVNKATLTAAHLLGVKPDSVGLVTLPSTPAPQTFAAAGLRLGAAFGTNLTTAAGATTYWYEGINGTTYTASSTGPSAVGIYEVTIALAGGNQFNALAAPNRIKVGVLVVKANDVSGYKEQIDSITCTGLNGIYGDKQSTVNFSTGCRALGQNTSGAHLVIGGSGATTQYGYFTATTPNNLLTSRGQSVTVSVTFTAFADTGSTVKAFMSKQANVTVNVASADIRPDFSNLDTTGVRRWVDSTDGSKATGAAFAAPVGGIKPLSASLSGLGTVSYTYRNWATLAVSSSAPWAKGKYTVLASIAAGSNYNATSAPIEVGTFSLENEEYTGRLNLASATATYFAAGAADGYAFKRPGLNAGVAGRVDSISTAAGRLTATFFPKTGPSRALVLGTDFSYRASDSSLVVKVGEVGQVQFVFDAFGKTAASGGFIWEALNQKWSVFIEEKELTADNVVVNNTVIEYTGADISDAVLSTKFDVKDGLLTVAENVGWEYESSARNRKTAGDSTAFIVIKGIGNYTNSQPIIVPFSITRKLLTPSLVVDGPKVYDGKATLDTATTPAGVKHVSINFAGLVGSASTPTDDAAMFKNTVSYTITDVTYANVNVNNNTTVTAKVTLLRGTDATARNYRFAAGNGDTATVTLPGEEVRVRTPSGANSEAMLPNASFDGTAAKVGDTSTFAFSIPVLMTGRDTVYFNGSPRGIGTVAFKGAIASPGAVLTTLYSYPNATSSAKPYFDPTFPDGAVPDTTILPRDAGTYMVKVRISGNGTNVANGLYKLGEFTIYPARAAVISTQPANVTTKLNQSKQLSVVAASPNGGTLRYQWILYENASDAVGTPITGANSATYTAPANEEKDFIYACRVTNAFSGSGASLIQVNSDTLTARKTVSVNGIAKTLTRTNTIITIDNTTPWVYTGFAVKPAGTAVTVKYIKGENAGDTISLFENTDYTLGYGVNTDVATGGTVRVEGIGDYESVVSVKFDIAKKDPGRGDLAYSLTREYDGDTVNAGVAPLSPRTGLGAISVRYDDNDTVPAAIGSYVVTAKTAGGANYNASADYFFVTMFDIVKATPSTSNVSATIPTGHEAGVEGTKYGIDTSTIKIKGTGYGTVSVLYNDSPVVPTAGGTYAVKISLSGGDNYNAGSVTIGNYVIKGAISVAEANREVPKSDVTTVAAVAPVKAVTASFTAGPSPAKLGGVVKFFSAKAVKSGALFIFDANGNAVAKTKVAAAAGEVASWNLKDKKGATVPEGTYVVKGALTGKDGTKEKVSFVFSVVR